MLSLSLDIRTLSVVLPSGCAVLSVVMLLLLRTHRTYPGFALWTAGLLAYTFGFSLIALRGMIPEIFTIIGANALLLGAAGLFLEGVRRFRGLSGRRLLSFLLVLLLVLFQSYFTFVADDVGVRIVAFSFLTAVLYGMAAENLLRHAPADERFSYLFTGSLFAIHALLMIVRCFFIRLGPDLQDFMTPSLTQTVTLLLALLMGIAWTFGFVMLNSERLESDLKRAQVELQRIATTDFLTGIANSRSFLEAGEREIQRKRRYGRPLAALMFDLDHFKEINDTYGHAAGDKVLVTLSAVCKKLLRDIDVFGRLGGEEFAMLLPETDLAGARVTAERLREAVAEAAIETERAVLHVTISIGVSEMGPADDLLDAVLKRADDAMYQAKRGGRNRVVVAASPVPPASAAS
ncbi:MAG: GGDEF domain-containing protein [Deltaproteobacteria bacterium]|nr:GGDEF domain-containing protein [Deltaproteobacteria bacterium]